MAKDAPASGPPTILDEAAAWARRAGARWVLTIRVQPGAARSAVVGPHGDALKVRVAAPATDGRANAELVRFLADQLDLPTRDVEVVRGRQSRTKVVEVRARG